MNLSLIDKDFALQLSEAYQPVFYRVVRKAPPELDVDMAIKLIRQLSFGALLDESDGAIAPVVSAKQLEEVLSDLLHLWSNGITKKGDEKTLEKAGDAKRHIAEGNFDAMLNDFGDIATKCGVDAMIDAYFSGVPLEDIVD